MRGLSRLTFHFSRPSWGWFFTWHGAERDDRAGCDLYVRLGPLVIGVPQAWDWRGQLSSLAKDRLKLIDELELARAASAPTPHDGVPMFGSAFAPRPGDPVCRRCEGVLLFSARQRGDGLCGPCSRLNRPACVACGADADVPLIWGFGLAGEAPGLMRVVNLCETCRPCAIKAATEAGE